MKKKFTPVPSKVVRVGNSQAVMIPAAVMRARGWTVGDPVEIEHMAGGVVVMEPDHHRAVVRIVQKLVRERGELIRRLADR